MTAIDLHHAVKRRWCASAARVRLVDGVPHRQGEYFALDDVGARVWEPCDASRSVADVVTVLLRRKA